jgi:hypothetical protein
MDEDTIKELLRTKDKNTLNDDEAHALEILSAAIGANPTPNDIRRAVTLLRAEPEWLEALLIVAGAAMASGKIRRSVNECPRAPAGAADHAQGDDDRASRKRSRPRRAGPAPRTKR